MERHEKVETGTSTSDLTLPIQPVETGKTIPLHTYYSTLATQWDFYRLSYNGGPSYKEGTDASGYDVFISHDREGDDGKERRKKQASYENHCREILDNYTSFVFRGGVRRDITNTEFVEWCKDVDMLGTSLDRFMRRITRKAQILGRYFVSVDSTKTPGLAEQVVTAEQEQSLGFRTYLIAVDPESVLDWRHKSGVLTECIIVYDSGAYAIHWTKETFVRYDLDRSGCVVQVYPPVQHGFGELPVIEVTPFEGDSQLKDVAEINKALFNLDALLNEEHFAWTFSSYVLFGVAANDMKNADATVGSRTFMCVKNPEATMQRLGSDKSQADSLRDTIKAKTEALYRQAGVRAPNPLDQNAPKSGVALAVEFDEVTTRLNDIARAAEHAENTIIRLWTAGEAAGTAPADSEYPDQFATPDETSEIARSQLMLGDANIVRTAKVLESRRLYSTLYPDATPEEKSALIAEVDEKFSEAAERQALESQVKALQGAIDSAGSGVAKAAGDQDANANDNAGEDTPADNPFGG